MALGEDVNTGYLVARFVQPSLPFTDQVPAGALPDFSSFRERRPQSFGDDRVDA